MNVLRYGIAPPVIYTVSQKKINLLLPITSPNVNRFANLPQILPAKEFWKLVFTRGSYGQEYSALFYSDSHCSMPNTCHTKWSVVVVSKTQYQTWNWVIGSPGQWVIFHVRVWDPSFSSFRKNAQNAKRTFEMLKWQKSLSGVCCWTEITGYQSMQWTVTFTYDYQKFFGQRILLHT